MTHDLKRNEELKRWQERYERRNREGRKRMLDEFCEQYRYERKYAAKLLGNQVPVRGRRATRRAWTAVAIRAAIRSGGEDLGCCRAVVRQASGPGVGFMAAALRAALRQAPAEPAEIAAAGQCGNVGSDAGRSQESGTARAVRDPPRHATEAAHSDCRR